MDDLEYAVVRVASDTLFAVMDSRVATVMERFEEVKALFKWLIDEYDFYVGNADAKEIRDLIESGVIVEVDLALADGGATLTIFKPKQPDEANPSE